MKGQNGAAQIVAALHEGGVRCAFGVPGTQTVELFEALRQSEIRTVLATSELAAAFMAGGWARVTGNPGVVITMPGPGFTWALTGIAEAFLDSIPLLHICASPPSSSVGRRFLQQEIAQSSVAAPLVKAIVNVDGNSDVRCAVLEALRMARAGEPGPVLLQVSPETLHAPMVSDGSPAVSSSTEDSDGISAVRARVVAASRPIFFVGLGVAQYGQPLREVIETIGCPVITTPSARGVVSDDHPLNFGFDPASGNLEEVNALFDSADLIIVLGAKLGHNGTSGYKLRLPSERLVHVDTSDKVIGVNYAVSLGVVADAGLVLMSLLGERPSRSSWTDAELRDRRTRVRRPRAELEPWLGGTPSGKPHDFFAALRRGLPPEAILVLDSGLHQVLARRHFSVQAPRGLLFPADLQSMGFAVPSAIGATLAAPNRPIVALIGDGGFAMTGLELLSAIRERIRLILIVFVDGTLGQIRMQQLASYGATHAVELNNPAFDLLAEAVGARYAAIGDDAERVIRSALSYAGVTLIEVPVGDTIAIHGMTAMARAREKTRAMGWLRLIKQVRRFVGLG